MKIIIAGSRGCTDPRYLDYALGRSAFPITEVVCGGASGADQLGKDWAVDADIPLAMYLADWDRYGSRAGIIRNIEMGQYADGLIALWDGWSRGTEHMIQYMMSLEKPVEVISFITPIEELT